MKRFEYLCAPDIVGITQTCKAALKKYAEQILFYDTATKNQEELILRVKDADAILINWKTSIDKKVIDASLKLKYIGVCGTNTAQIDLESARERGIQISTVKNYTDFATVEFIFQQILNYYKGNSLHDNIPNNITNITRELYGKNLGIVGLGVIGEKVAQMGLAFGMQVFYYSRTRKEKVEEQGVTYLPLQELLKHSEVISFHVPPFTQAVTKEDLRKLNKGTLLINTCVGAIFNEEELREYILLEKSTVIFDRVAGMFYSSSITKLPHMVVLPTMAGITVESVQRLDGSVLANVRKYLNN